MAAQYPHGRDPGNSLGRHYSDFQLIGLAKPLSRRPSISENLQNPVPIGEVRVGIAERCNMRLEKVSSPFPHFDVPAGFTLDSYFEHVTREGFARRLDTLRPLENLGRLKHSIAEYEQRLARELAIIQQMNFSGYFLIVWDFIRYARDNNIPVGPGRGSAAGSPPGRRCRVRQYRRLAARTRETSCQRRRR